MNCEAREAMVKLALEEDDLPFCKIDGCEALRDGCWKNCPYGVKEEEESEAK